MSLPPLKNGIALNELDAWSNVTNFGFEVLEGEVNAS